MCVLPVFALHSAHMHIVKALHRHPMLSVVACVVLSNVLIYACTIVFHSGFPFHQFNYTYNAYHFMADPRADGGLFDFLPALGQYDAQWYLRIAATGYPDIP